MEICFKQSVRKKGGGREVRVRTDLPIANAMLTCSLASLRTGGPLPPPDLRRAKRPFPGKGELCHCIPPPSSGPGKWAPWPGRTPGTGGSGQSRPSSRDGSRRQTAPARPPSDSPTRHQGIWKGRERRPWDR